MLLVFQIIVFELIVVNSPYYYEDTRIRSQHVNLHVTLVISAKVR